MFSSPAYAAAGGAAGGPGLIMQVLPLILIFVVFWFLLIRPQQKRMKEHRAMVENLRRGDTVVTNGGMVGKIVKVADDEITVEIAEGVRIRQMKSMIAEVRSKTAPAEKPAAKDAAKDDKS